MRQLFFLLLLSQPLFAQNYFQQQVDYTIEVTLNDNNHSLMGQESFIYTNNSPETLKRIYIHLWPNAYKNENTALAKQQYLNGDDELTFANDEKRGFIDSLDFKVNDQKANWYFEEYNQDIAILELNSELKPGQSIKVSTPFYVKLPSGSISRLGHIGQSYQITQWYPKPAVYDKDGWHHMPYLNQGEFYSEYGSFDVSITLPENYVVGATGDLQTDSEIDFLTNKALQTQQAIDSGQFALKINLEDGKGGYPVSSSTFKTIRYTQSNVHDFAWFADKRYSVLKGEIELPHSKRKVTSWAMYTPRNGHLWKNAIEYINDGTYYYSLWNGDYPYNNVTAVDGTISAGGGMEYPNVTVIGNTRTAQDLEVVIVHEVGHNWFYGQLGSNERVHGWMDEGMNTLNEVRYMQTKYPNNTAMSDMVLNGAFHFNDLDHHDMSDVAFRGVAGLGEDQPIETHSARFSQANYGVIMYQKTGLVFYYLKDYLGEELFDQCMREYYRQWEFKHPQPEDMRLSIETTSGKDLNWLFDDLINTTDHIDYKLKAVKRSKRGYIVKTRNVGQVDGPIEVNGFINDSLVSTAWIEPGNKKNEIELITGGQSLDKVLIDYGNDIPEINRQNNTWIRKGLLDRVEPLKLEFLVGDNESEYTNIFWAPFFASNYYDKFMLGTVIHNYGIPFNKFNYMVLPMYSFGREMISGISEISYTSTPRKTLKLSRIGVSVKSFKQDTLYRGNQSHYLALMPYWMAKIGNRKNNHPYAQDIRLQTIYRKDKSGPHHSDHAGGYIEYNFNYHHPDHKAGFSVRNDFIYQVQHEDKMARILFESDYSFRYMRKKNSRWISLRVFAGHEYIRDFDEASVGYKYSMSLAGTDGQQDLFLDEYYFGRNNISGIWSQQRQENMGGFKSTSYYGTTSYGMATANLYFQLPIPTGLLGLYADGGIFHNGKNVQEAFQVGAGIRLGEYIGIYFPIWMSKQLDESFGNSKYAEKIRFTLKMNLLNKPLNLSNLF